MVFKDFDIAFWHILGFNYKLQTLNPKPYTLKTPGL